MKLKNVLYSIFALGMTLLLTGCKLVVLQPKGIVAAHEKQLFIDALQLMLIIVVPVIILTLVIARRYRASNKKAKYSPKWSHSVALELVWWSIPIIIIGILAVMTWRTTHELDPYKPLSKTTYGNVKGIDQKPVVIQAVALRWKWLFIYPKQNIATVNYVKLPVHTPIRFQISSDAPMNALQIPALGGQIYAMNGMRTKLHLLADHKGTYQGRSVSFSGTGFDDMAFAAHVVSKSDFNQWIQQVQSSPKSGALTINSYNQLVKPSENNAPAFYSPVKSGLFKHIMNKFLTPPHEHINSEHFQPVKL